MPLGHRIRLLKAISNLEASEKSAVAPASETLPHSPGPPIPEAVGERRYLTVMFCDLVNSTGIAAKLDAEEWRDLVGAYLDAASAAVTEMGGKVTKKLGDRLMALFGYPVAQENDAERAVRAALAIQRSLAELNRKNEATDKPALAAPVGPRHLTPLVGREEEIAMLLRRWSRAKNGQGQVVLLSGEASISKSRLTAALFERLASEPHTRLRYFCSPQRTDSAFYRIIGQMKRATALARDDSTQLRLDKLDAVLSPTSTSKAGCRLFAEMLSLLKAISARPQRTDGRARLSISLDEAVAPCSFQCAAHCSRLFH
jgi:hypothetical protein